jgi:sporulation protein YlmC with PRC-barrel domain
MAIEGTNGNLIASDKVVGTAVYGADKEKIGSIERVMIEKKSGQVSYAVLSIGGFFGLGDDHYPVPWNQLKYDTELGGYRTSISGNRLNGAPKHGADSVLTGQHEAKRSMNTGLTVAVSLLRVIRLRTTPVPLG